MNSNNRDNLKILLLQIRDQPAVRVEEYASFCQYAGLHPEQLDIHNVFDMPEFDSHILAGYDALFVGGASEASVLEPENYPFVNASIDLMRSCIASSFPVFASCFGYQLAVLALGGNIIRDQRDFEMGCVDIQLTAEARDDKLFFDFPATFPAVAVHRERSLQHPPNSIPLAYSPQCNHAFRVVDKPFWAFQFHPEVDRRILIERLTIFQSKYTENAEHLQEVLDGAVETPLSNQLPALFVERVLLPCD